MGNPSRVTVAPKQSLGQNFLVDDNIARNIVRDLHLAPGDTVIEIGPGQGALTEHLAGRAGKVMAVELDGRVIENLRERFAGRGVEVLHGDFLELPLRTLCPSRGSRVRIVGNIPYHLTSSILFKAFDEHESVRDLTIMVQREVARRITAAPSSKEYGIPSVLARFYGTPEILFHVSPNCFYPRPKVTSSVVQIAFFDKLPYTVDTKLFREIVKTTFGKRRKTLRNSLSYLPYDAGDLLEVTRSQEAVLERRPEQLNVDEFAQLTTFVHERLRWRKPATT
jgi:16S rRNA (adenine1518-N6/adenine1519-N6)-dimethyltransferase